MKQYLDSNCWHRIRWGAWAGVFGAVLSVLIAPQQLLSQAIPVYLQAVVSHTAPLIIQETTDNFTNVEAKDHILPVDFDGNTIGADNYANAFDPTRVENGEATVYYSAAETGYTSDRGYYFIGYYVYHPGDGGGSFTAIGLFPSAFHGHEHDMEGSYFVVKKTPWSPYGEIQVALTEAHGALIPYRNENAAYVAQSTQAGSGILGFIYNWYDPTFSTFRPVVAIRTRTHANYMAQDCSSTGYHLDLPFPTLTQYGMNPHSPAGTYISCIHSGTHNIVYSPVPANGAPSSGIWPHRLGPTFHNGFAYYRLVELVNSPLWSLRSTYGQLLWGSYVNVGDGSQYGYSDFRQSGAYYGCCEYWDPFFNGVDANSTANAPWAWRGGIGEVHSTPFGGAAWYSFGMDMTDTYSSPGSWPQSPYGRLLGNPNAEIAMRFPSLPQMNEPVIYNPYGAVSPPPSSGPLAADIMGPVSVTAGVGSTWQAIASWGTPPYTFQWSGALSGTGQFASGALYSDSILYLDVWDASGSHVAVSTSISVVDNCGGQAC